MMRPDLPPDLRARLHDTTWHAVSEGESDATVYRLEGQTRRYLKISRADAQYPVRNDAERLRWLAGRIVVPEVLYYGESATQQYLLMSDCPGLFPLHDDLPWTPEERVACLASAARAFHALSVTDCPYRMTFDDQIALAKNHMMRGLVREDDFDDDNLGRPVEDLFAELVALRPVAEDPVVTHGDLYPLNIRVLPETGEVTGYIDVGAMAVADRYHDLVPITNAIGWHLGDVWIERFFELYGIVPNWNKLRFYRLLQEFL